MLQTHLKMSSLIFCLAFLLILLLVLCPALLLMLCLISLMYLTITYVVLVHERIIFCLDALDMNHILIVVTISRICLVFLMEGLTSILSPDTWMVYIFLIVHVPLGQVVRC
jgi:uncharacterized protein YjeT (DUF2065 family)